MKALLIVDLQNDFLPGGALPVKEANQMIPFINDLMNGFDYIVATKDWHPKGHCSFSKWPQHCVQNSFGSAFPKELNADRIDKIVYKGEDSAIDSYSGFFDNEHKKETKLYRWLQEKGIDELFIVGLATEYCVKATVLDALALGFRTTVVREGCRGLDPVASAHAFAEMKEKGALLQ